MRPASLKDHGYLLLRMIAVTTIATAIAITAIASAKAGISTAVAGDTGFIQAGTDPGQGQDASRTSTRCAATGFCWVLPVRSGGLAPRAAVTMSHALPETVRAEAKWRSGPPEQPPRKKG